MALSLNKSVHDCSSGYSTLGVLFAPLSFLHPANSEHSSIVEEAIQKATFPKPYYHADVVAGPEPAFRALGWQ